MQLSTPKAVALLAAAALAGAATVGTSAFAGSTTKAKARKASYPVTLLVNTALTPSVPTDPVIDGVTAGSAPWVLTRGDYTLYSNGVVQAEVRGLIIPALGTPGPVTEVDFALYCGGSTTAAAVTTSTPLSTKGDASLVARVAVPTTCLAPQVLVEPNGVSTIYITASGFGG